MVRVSQELPTIGVEFLVQRVDYVINRIESLVIGESCPLQRMSCSSVGLSCSV